MDLFNFVTNRFNLSRVTSKITFENPYKIIINPKLSSLPHFNCIFPNNSSFHYTDSSLAACKDIFKKYSVTPHVYKLNKNIKSIDYGVYELDKLKLNIKKSTIVNEERSLNNFLHTLKLVFLLSDEEILQIKTKFKQIGKYYNYSNYLVSNDLKTIGCFSLIQFSKTHNILGNIGLLSSFKGKGLSYQLFAAPFICSKLPMVIDTSHTSLTYKVLEKTGYNKIGTLFLTPLH